jgi:hypothetical protein
MLSVQARRGPQAYNCDTFRPRPPAGGVAAGLRPGTTAHWALCPMMRRACLIAAALTTLGAVPACAGEPGAPASDARPITKLLPQTRNHKICFTARFGDGGVPLARPGGHLQSLTAELYWDDAEPDDYSDGSLGYDRRYELMLMARIDGQRNPMFGGLECPYRDRARIDPKTGETIEGPSATGLFCYQDCVGGSLHFEADGKALIVVLDGEDGVRLGQDLQPGASATRLRLEPAPVGVCQPIEDYYFKD